MRRILSLALLALACGNTSRSHDLGMGSGGAGGSVAGAPSSGGASGNGSGGMPSSGGSAVAGAPSNGGSGGSGDFIDDFIDAAGAVCREVRRCYPEQQTDPTQCTGPADNGLMVVWVDPTAGLDEADRAALAACLRASEDQQALLIWLSCFSASEEEEAACVETCPESLEACANAGNVSNDMCDAFQPADAAVLERCFAEVL